MYARMFMYVYVCLARTCVEVCKYVSKKYRMQVSK